MIGLALTLSATPVLAESNNDIVLYGPIGQCDVCGYAYATTVYTYGDLVLMDEIITHMAPIVNNTHI